MSLSSPAVAIALILHRMDILSRLVRADRARSARASAVLALTIWTGLIVGAALWGHALTEAGSHIKLNAPPFHGRYDLRVTWRLIVPVCSGAAAIVFLPSFVRRTSWRGLLVVTAVAAGVWALALAFTNGWDSLTAPVTRRTEYLSAVSMIDSPGDLLGRFTARLGDYPLHVRGHPPGFVLLLWFLGELGLGGPRWAAAIAIAGGAAMAPASLLALREVAGEAPARAAAPFLALAPAAVWVATSADAFFAGVACWGVALFALATGSRARGRDALALAAGLVLGAALFLTYGALLMGTLFLALALRRRAGKEALVCALGVVAVGAAFLAAGFWWFDGLLATLEHVRAGVAGTRPLAFFAVANLAAFGLALGPAVPVALVRLRDEGAWTLVAAALVAVTLADLSGLSKGEVERIWLPFVPWLLVATCALARERRVLFGAQILVAILLQAWLRSPW